MNIKGARVEIHAAKANEEQMRVAVEKQTGDGAPFFCPRVVQGIKYEGHAHVFLPEGVTEPDLAPIVLR